jgi:hypothetical protein
MENKNRVLVNFIQDRSGSMQSVWEETVSGFKQYVLDLKQDPDAEYLFSLTTFDTVVDTPHVAEPIAGIPDDALADFGPRGGTALYDAVGANVRAAESREGEVDTVLVVIVTDGYENSSREWTKARVRALLDEKHATGKWTFVYLGTQPETWDDAAAMGVSPGNAMSRHPARSGSAYDIMSVATRLYGRSGQKSSKDFNIGFIDPAQAAAAGIKTKRETDPKGDWPRK